ncbi:MAG: hypothetical protein ACR2IB_08995 [Pyrinomonadaceae bacterium]
MSASLRLVGETSGLVDRALEIAQRRRATVQQLCRAVLDEDLVTAKTLAKELEGEASNRANQGEHGISGQ